MSDFTTQSSQTTKFKVGVCQILVGADKNQNISKAASAIDATNDANLVVSGNSNLSLLNYIHCSILGSS